MALDLPLAAIVELGAAGIASPAKQTSSRREEHLASAEGSPMRTNGATEGLDSDTMGRKPVL
jgi:hypothetical protein